MIDEIQEIQIPKAYAWTLKQLQEVHDLTGCAFFGCEADDEHKVKPTIQMQNGKYIFGVDKIKRKFPELDMSKYKTIEYVPQEIE